MSLLLFCSVLRLRREKQPFIRMFFFSCTYFLLVTSCVCNMQYKAENEKVLMMSPLYTPRVNRMSFKDDPQIQRTRKTLIIILGVCLVSSFW